MVMFSLEDRCKGELCCLV